MANPKIDPVLAARQKALDKAKAERNKLPRGAGSFVQQSNGKFKQQSNSPAAKKHPDEEVK